MYFQQVMRLIILLISIHGSAFAKYDLSICCIFQNDAPYLKEWIEFHKLQGVEHFYMYNNNSEDEYQAVLDPYIQNEEVTLIQWPYRYDEQDHPHWIRIQTGSYMDCINKFGEETTWLAAIDTDEYLYDATGGTLTDFLKDCTLFGGVAVNWVKFGTSGWEEIPEGFLMMELLTRCMPLDDTDNCKMKAIVQPKYVDGCSSVHYFHYIEGIFAVDTEKERLQKATRNKSSRILLNRLRINHYWTRTEKFFREKKIDSRLKRRNTFSVEELYRMAEMCNSVENKSILQFVPKMRKVMGYE